MEYILPKDKDHLGLLIKYIKLKGKQFVGKDQIKGKSGEKLLPDEYVSKPHILHDLIRGIYKPKGWNCMLSYLATEKEENYGKQIIWNDKSKYDFQKIILQSPNGEKDNRKISDINAAKYAMDHKIPIGILLNEDKGINRCLGIGLIESMDKYNNFNIVPLNLDLEEIERKVNMNTSNNFFIFRSNDPDDVNRILDENIEELEISRIANYYGETEIGDKILFVLGGDKPNWKLGLRCICTIASKPYDRGYDSNNHKYYKVKIKKELLLKDSISREEMVPYRDLYNMTFIGPMLKGEPNQINIKTNSGQVISVIRAILDKYPNTKDELIRIFGDDMIDKALKVENILINQSEIKKQLTDIKKINSSELGKEDLNNILNYINKEGFIYSYKDICNFYLSLKTKPFVILSGISGTGKSKIVELFAKSLGATAENKRFNLVPVKPDWSDSTDLLGFRNIEGKFTPGIITKVCYDAMMNPEKSYFICLDEMNLARVEYYFSDILSLMETRRLNEDNEIITNTLLSEEQIGRDSVSISTYGDVYIPQNLYIIGTVNMDETTFPFSKKVLDRANTIEFNKVDLNYSFEDDDSSSDNSNNNEEIKIYHNDFLKSEFLKIKECKEFKDTAQKAINELIKINKILEKYNYHFGYRVRDEITFYMIYAVKDNLMSFDEAFDLCVVQKILPKISGSSSEVLDMLYDIFELFNKYRFSNREYLEEKELKELKEKVTDLNEGSEKINYKFKLTNEKLIYMIRRFIRDGFTTFWQ